MKRTIIILLAVASFSSCKMIESITGKKKTEPTTQTETPAQQSKVFTTENEKPAVRENPTSDQMYAKPQSAPVCMRKENFTFSQPEDVASNQNMNFFLIVGSFGSYENATKLKTDLMGKGFTPIVLKSETGNFRVCSNSFNTESDARKKVNEIRQKYPNFNDCWLLIKK